MSNLGDFRDQLERLFGVEKLDSHWTVEQQVQASQAISLKRIADALTFERFTDSELAMRRLATKLDKADMAEIVRNAGPINSTLEIEEALEFAQNLARIVIGIYGRAA